MDKNKMVKDKLQNLIPKIIEVFGQPKLFALAQQQEDQSNWDLLISIPGLEKREDFSKFIATLQDNLLIDELKEIARVIFLKTEDATVKNINKAMKVNNGFVDLENSSLNGIFFRKLILFISE